MNDRFSHHSAVPGRESMISDQFVRVRLEFIQY
ncbi:hypothetical protein Barb6_00764 [Bacteroidales bacterium Barb6]|nr:hypothetical protein Barb4_00723 [Bacteroidales bacterium Barb4]OAV72862.1 hypothetical protein Barb6_00764 [Bacteroidales bacterium Barb6]